VKVIGINDTIEH